MRAIFLKDLGSFFSSLIGYIVLIGFLLILGLITWVFPDSSILENPYAQLDPLFSIAPLIFMFLIPALTMRSFAEEFNGGTIELLFTKPISDVKLVVAKYFAYLSIVLLALIPTFIYYYSVYQLGSPKGNLDSGAIVGSYIGLFLLAAVYVAIGVFSSALTKNQISAFVVGCFLCFFFTWFFDFVSTLPMFYGSLDDLIERLGIYYHYSALSKGLISWKDVIYFLSITIYFIALTLQVLKSKRV
jgi:ABC-2 type transport system permease protein